MVYENILKVNKQYPDRNEMSFDEELSYIEDCFDTYENNGFLKEFKSPFKDNKKYNGLKFSVDRRLGYSIDDVEIGWLPLWRITLENGEVIDASPEEICIIDYTLK